VIAMRKIIKTTGRKAVNFKDIIQSLQSEERKKVYLYLSLTYPAWMTITNIARSVQSDYKNVKGALEGDGVNYSKKFALIKVGIVEHKIACVSAIKVNLYRVKRRNSIIFAE
jgi:predicted transcriptional regulator with HTH domain